MRATTRTAISTFAAATVLLASACSLEKEKALNETLESAKATAMELENRISESIPAEWVVSQSQNPTGLLLRCDEKSDLWAGGTDLNLREEFDADVIFERIQDHLSDLTDYTTARREQVAGAPGLAINGPGEAQYFITINQKKLTLAIDSFSSCFPLPDGMDHNDRY